MNTAQLMNHSRRNFIAMAAAGLTGGIGCATSTTAGYQSSAPPASARSASGSGLEVSLDPFIEPARTKQYFRIDAVNDGIGILHVRIVNRTNDTTFLLEKKNVRLVPRGETASRSATEQKIDRATAGGEATALVGATAISLPLMFAGMAMISQSTEIRRNLVDKEFQDQTIGPGQTTEGFIYFSPIPKKVDWSAGAAISLIAAETRTGKSVELNVPLSR